MLSETLNGPSACSLTAHSQTFKLFKELKIISQIMQFGHCISFFLVTSLYCQNIKYSLYSGIVYMDIYAISVAVIYDICLINSAVYDTKKRICSGQFSHKITASTCAHYFCYHIYSLLLFLVKKNSKQGATQKFPNLFA